MRRSKGRVVHANAFARRSLPKFLLRLEFTQPSDWPPHLLRAWQIVNGTLGLSAREALSVMLDSVSAAHRCVVAENQGVNQIEEREALKKVRTACKRVLERIEDAPSDVSAKLRRRLDKEILPLIREPVIDLEVIQAIFEAAAGVFGEFPKRGRSPLPNLLHEVQESRLSTLGATLRRKLELAITDLGNPSAAKRADAVQVFETLAGILFAEKTPKIKTGTHLLRSKYVGELAAIWRRAGLKPSRANHPSNPNYRSKFHRFAEFVLTEIAQPQSRRHDPNIKALVAPLAPMDLPEEIRGNQQSTEACRSKVVNQRRPSVGRRSARNYRARLHKQWHLIPCSKLGLVNAGIGTVPSTEGGKRNPQNEEGPRPYLPRAIRQVDRLRRVRFRECQ